MDPKREFLCDLLDRAAEGPEKEFAETAIKFYDMGLLDVSLGEDGVGFHIAEEVEIITATESDCA